MKLIAKVVLPVLVVVGTTTHVSTSAQPISTINTVSGTVTASANATVRALQSVSTGKYEIASANANLDTGAFTMSLPTAAPLVGSYSNALPIALTAATTSAGQYTLEADAASGATQSAAVNIANGSLSNVNFSF